MTNALFQRRDPAKLQAQIEKAQGGSYNQADLTIWDVTKDTAGNGSAVIRFLPDRDTDRLPYTEIINHFFKGNNGNKHYSELCTSTHGDYASCPVCEFLKAENLYETNRPLYDKVKRKFSFWSNILVIKDPANPENEGKVFKYRYGIKIKQKIDAMNKGDEALDQAGIDPFCLLEGANFQIKVKKAAGFSNYDDCRFLTPGPIKNITTDEALQKYIADTLYDLSYINDPKTAFKSYEENKKEFDLVMGTAALGGAAGTAAAAADAIGDELADFDAQMNQFTANANTPQNVEKTEAVIEKAAPVETASAPAGDNLDDLMKEIDGI